MNKLKKWISFNSPESGTHQEWREFNRSFKNTAPMRYWFKNQLMPMMRAKIHKPIEYVRYRTYAKYHVVKTDLSPGYRDTDSRMLHAAMSLMVDFVEQELAALDLYCDKNASWFERYSARYNPRWRSAKRGLRYLNQSTEITEKKLLSIYKWWTLEYPKYESMASELLESRRDSSLNDLDLFFTASDDTIVEQRYLKQQEDMKAVYQQVIALENTQQKITQVMLHKLIDIRESMWT